MTEGIVYVTDQGTKHELQFADDPKCIVKDAEVDGMIGVRP